MASQCLRFAVVPLAGLLVAVCTAGGSPVRDIVDDPFPGAEAELRAVVERIGKDAMTADIESLQAIHLDSPKFSKFGPRRFERQGVEQTNESEAAFFGSVKNLVYEAREIKIDMFGDVGVVTYYPYVSFTREGERVEIDGRQTLVFLRTEGEWKIVHEHGTVRE